MFQTTLKKLGKFYDLFFLKKLTFVGFQVLPISIGTQFASIDYLPTNLTKNFVKEKL